MSIKKDVIRYTPRQEQRDALDFIQKILKEKPDNKFFLFNMPPGIGKSHFAIMVANHYLTKIDKSSSVDIITAGKILQDQYSESYPSINNLKGKENYGCAQYSCSCSQGKEFNRLNKTKCDFCPYDDAKNWYINGQVSLTNFYLYLIYAIYNNGGINDQRKSKVLIVDECHDLDDVISDFIAIKITEGTIKKLKFSNENEIIKRLKSIKNILSYIDFLKYLLVEIQETIGQLDIAMSSGGRSFKSDIRDLRISKITGGTNSDVKIMQVITDLKQYKTKIETFLKEYEENPHNWVLETKINDKTNNKELSLEPIWANDYLNKYVWSKYDLVILMSGTILNRDLFSEINGIDADESVFYSIPSPFPKKNRPIYYMPLGKMSYTKKQETFKNYVHFLPRILKKYSDKKGVIHTNSFELSTWIERDIKDPLLVFHDSLNRDEMLKMHMETDKPTVFQEYQLGLFFCLILFF